MDDVGSYSLCSRLQASKPFLGFLFALDVFTVAKQDYSLADQGSVICGPGPAFLRWSPGPQRWMWMLISTVPLLITVPMKHHTNLTSLLSFVASVELARVPPAPLLASSERRQAHMRAR